jgi:hypothetical protein
MLEGEFIAWAMGEQQCFVRVDHAAALPFGSIRCDAPCLTNKSFLLLFCKKEVLTY